MAKPAKKAVLCIHRPNQPNKQALPAAVLKNASLPVPGVRHFYSARSVHLLPCAQTAESDPNMPKATLQIICPYNYRYSISPQILLP